MSEPRNKLQLALALSERIRERHSALGLEFGEDRRRKPVIRIMSLMIVHWAGTIAGLLVSPPEDFTERLTTATAAICALLLDLYISTPFDERQMRRELHAVIELSRASSGAASDRMELFGTAMLLTSAAVAITMRDHGRQPALAVQARGAIGYLVRMCCDAADIQDLAGIEP